MSLRQAFVMEANSVAGLTSVRAAIPDDKYFWNERINLNFSATSFQDAWAAYDNEYECNRMPEFPEIVRIVAKNNGPRLTLTEYRAALVQGQKINFATIVLG